MRALTLLATVSLLGCASCDEKQSASPRASNRNSSTARHHSNAVPPPDWVIRLIKKQGPQSTAIIEESTYQGDRAFLIMPRDRAPDSGNEHVLYSEDGRVICEFGGFAGHVTGGSCDIGAIKHVRTLFPTFYPL